MNLQMMACNNFHIMKKNAWYISEGEAFSSVFVLAQFLHILLCMFVRKERVGKHS
jgi:hypothetical protein